MISRLRKIRVLWLALRWWERTEKEIKKMKTNPSFAAAAVTGTGISGAIAATLAVAGLWLPVFTEHAPITSELLSQTLGVISLWVTLIFARKAVLKAQSGTPQ